MHGTGYHISLRLTKFLWADFRFTKGGIKLHQSILVHEDRAYPDSAVMTQAKGPTKPSWKNLVVVDQNVLNVFDRGYVDYKIWDKYCKTGIKFVSRLKNNALIQVLEEKQDAAGEEMYL